MAWFGLRTFYRRSGMPLALRLGVLVCALSTPIVVLMLNEHARLEREIGRFRTETVALRWIARADDFINGVNAWGTRPGTPAFAPVHRRNAAKLAELERYSAANAATLPWGIPGTARMRRAWEWTVQTHSSAARAKLATETGLAIDAVSDGSGQSFESHEFVANLGDVIDNAYYRVFAPLGAAAATVQYGATQPSDRFAIAGQIAVARQFHSNLAVDMQEGFDKEPSARRKLEPLWKAALTAATALERELMLAIEKPGIRAAPPTLRHDRSQLAQRTTAFVAASEAATEAGYVALVAEDRAAERMDFLLGLVAMLVLAVLGAVAIRLIQRRDRRELERAQRDARALSAELARQQAERARMLTEAQFDAVFDRSQMGIALLDESGTVVECNPALRTMLGTTSPVLVTPDDPHFAALAAGRSATYQHETALERHDGEPRWSQITISSVDVVAEPVTAIAMVQDISERKAIEERLRYAAAHDDLTALLNRTQFLAHLEAVLLDAKRAHKHAVLFIDLDRFKLINDTLGHPAGDRAITITAERLLATTRPDDVLARLHGDEFALLLADSGNPSDASIAAERIKEHLIAPIHFGETSFGLTASIGIVAGLERYASAEHVMRDADLAMYHAKSLGRANAVVFDGTMSERLSEQMRILTDLRTALPRGEIYVAYQPIVSLRTSAALGFEALLRWSSPTLGDVSPTAFIPIAEESDTIHELGRYALSEACRLIERLDAAGWPALRANVNLSVAQLVKGDIAAEVRAAVNGAGIDASRLTLEITESGLLENKARARGVLDELHRLGVKLCIDDFGTGYSSLRYLHEFPIDILKIDRSFVNGSEGGLANAPIVEMLLSLAGHLEVGVVAEGIETERQRQALLDAGCEVAQGYLFGRALTEPQFIAWLRAAAELREAARIVKAS